jgi:phosphatidylglycerophosphate synthase
MTFIYVTGDNDIKIWGLTPRERIIRQAKHLPNVRLIDDLSRLGQDASVLIVDCGYVVEPRALQALLTRPNVVLRCPANGNFAAAHVSATNAALALSLLDGRKTDAPAALDILTPSELDGFDKSLRRSAAPLLEPVSTDGHARLEDTLYGNAYKGITDLVTKFVWPRPAKRAVRWCANAGVSPNAVTITGFILMLLAGALFLQGHYVLGLVLGWIMTFLDTVDGKLARVTVQSSRFGHVLDHGMDIVHPPFWYALWGMGLDGFWATSSLDRAEYSWIIFAGYIIGRLCEAGFHAYAKCSMFGWRPFDAYFRLITARRNPCLILLTAAILVGRPDIGFVAVVTWTAATTAVLAARLAYARSVYVKHGPLQSWLAEPAAAARDHPRAYRVFAVTRAAYPSA